MLTSLVALIILFVYVTNIAEQICDEEIVEEGIKVTWPRSPPANNVISDPLCYNNDYLITRNCENTQWIPPLPKLKPCLQDVKHYDPISCPPGFNSILDNNEHCYQIGRTSSWDGPCIKSSGLITDLREEDLLSLLHSLRKKNITRFFWLPARREKKFQPIRWHIPGPKWGIQVKANNSLTIRTSPLKNCLLLDIENKLLITETCSKQYPNLCFYRNKLQVVPICPNKYHAVQFMPHDGVCYGIEYSDTPLTFEDFLLNKCPNPMGESNNNDLSRFVFKKLAKFNTLPDNTWCWFTRIKNIDYDEYECYKNITAKIPHPQYYSDVMINNVGTLSLFNSSTLTKLSCMACIKEMEEKNIEFVFEYKAEDHLIHLTVYSPSGLWKYNPNDSGIQCFSNAEGFVSIIDINEVPFNYKKNAETALLMENKKLFTIKLITNRTAQYWCEGHSNFFSLINTEKIVVNPLGDRVHVFSLFVKLYFPNNYLDNLDDMKNNLCQNIASVFGVKKVLIMDIYEDSIDNLLVLFHLHVEIDNKYISFSRNIVNAFEKLKVIAQEDLVGHNYTFVNISSALLCLPTTTIDNILILEWEITLIDHIAAPSQFCLQASGLPVKRLCSGSYLLGSVWGEVEGSCDKNYVASETTKFLYNFVRGHVSKENITRFLTVELGSILGNVDSIIPADIYYLSIALKRVLSIFQNNHTLVDLGNIPNMAWVMDRMLSLDTSYLMLAQTLNSTNVILDSINEILEILSLKNINNNHRIQNDFETLAIQPQCIMQILYPKRNNISGIAIVNTKKANNFIEMSIKALYKNSTLNDVLSMDNLEVAAWLPDKVLNSVQKITNITDNITNSDNFDNENVNIVITVFNKDVLFQEINSKHKVNSRLISISIPGFILNFNDFVPLVFRTMHRSNLKSFCGYWDFKARKRETILGTWSRRGCFLDKTINQITICKCYHLTHFSHLLHVRKTGKSADEKHTKALNIITLIGSFLSLFGIACIWITACVFQIWRKKAGTKVLLHFSVSIALPLIFMVLFNLDNTIFGEEDGLFVVHDHMKATCIILGALLHYSILASFMWMLITAVLQFIRYVRVLGVRRPSRFMLRLTIIGWGVPIIPVLILLHVSKESYIPDSSNCHRCSICYPKGVFLILSVVVPVCLILFINIVVFVLVLWSVIKGPDGKCRSPDVNLTKAQLRLSIFLFFLLGLTWIFGFFSFSKQLIWSYLFCLTSSLQGFVLFVYFILCDPNTRSLWVTLVKCQYRPRLSRESISSISSG